MNSGLTDTHCHLYFRDFAEDLNEVLSRAWDEGVERILIPGIDLDTSRQAVDLTEKHPNLFAAVGVHPNDALTWNASTASALRDLTAHPKTVAIGEIGLDYYRDHAPKDVQTSVFLAQLDLAREVEKPVVVHNRNAIHDLWTILESWQAGLATANHPLALCPGVLHSFDESLFWGKKAAIAHFYLGISGPVTFPKAIEKHELVTGLELEDLLIETDAPFLTPIPYRGRRNEPSYTRHIAVKIAELKQLPVNLVVTQTASNAVRLFGW